MPVNSDIRQSVILALQTEGVDALGIVRDAMREVQGEIAVLNQEFDGTHPAEYLRSLQSYGKTLDWLAGEEKKLTQALNVGVRERIAAVEREARVRMEAAERAAAVDGEALRRRIDAAARAERAEEQLAQSIVDAVERARIADIEALGQRARERARLEQAEERLAQSIVDAANRGRVAQIEAMGDRAQAYARAEREAEEADNRRRQAEGDDLRRRIDAIAREERAREQSDARLLQAVGDAQRARIEGYARAERQQEAAAEAAIRSAGDEKRARVDAAVAAEQAEERTAARIKAANEEIKLQIGELKRQRIDAYAAADEAVERHRRAILADEEAELAALAAVDAKLQEKEGLAKRERAEAVAAADQRAEARRREAAATAAVTQNTTELAHALQEMHRVEQSAPAFNFMSEPGRNVVGKTTEEIAALQSQMARFNSTTAVASGGLYGFIDRLNPFNRATTEAARKTTDLSHANDDFNRSTRQASYGLLAFSYAVQDFQQSGLSAVMNNIPMMVMGIGGSAGLAGATMIAAAAFEAAAPHLTEYGRRIGALRDPLRDAAGDIAGLKEKLQALEDKPFKVAADYSALRQMREELEKTEKAVAEWEALKDKRTKVQEESKQIIEEGIVEGGGKRNVEEAILEIKKKQGNYGAESEFHGQLAYEKDTLKGYSAMLAKSRSYGMVAAPMTASLELLVENTRAKIEDLRDKIDKEARAKIGETVSHASTSEAARQELEDYYMKNRAIFESHGVTPKFGEGIVLGSRANVEAERARAKADRDQQEAAKKAKKEADDKAKAREATIDAAVADTKGGSDDLLEKRLQNAIEGRATPGAPAVPASAVTPEAAVARERAPLIEGLKGRGVAEDVVGEVADRLLHKAREAAMNNIAEGKKPKLDVKAEADLNKAADKVDQAFTDKAAAYFTGQALAAVQGAPMARTRREERNYQATGQPYYLPAEEQSRWVEATIGRDLRATGQDPRLAPIIRQRAAGLASQRSTEAMSRTPLPDASAMAEMVGGRNAQAMAAQAQATAALLDVLRTFNAKIEQSMGLNRRTAANARTLNNNARRQAENRGSLLPGMNPTAN